SPTPAAEANPQEPSAAPSSNQPASSPGASPTPDPEPGQPGSPVTYPKPSYPDLLPRFDYDTKSGLTLRETNIEKRDNVMLIELNYAGASGDRVPAYLVFPRGNGPYPAIIWGHWLMKGSPLANKDEFLEEALALARAGVVSLLVESPQARHEYVQEKGLLESARQQSDSALHQVIDLRRAVDLLRLRHNVDPKRIAYVGHSWNAHTGAILAGIETRICCFVLMASGYSDEEEAFTSRDPQIARYRQQLGDDALHEYFHEYAFDDPVYFLGHTDRESVFLQFASGDAAPGTDAAAYKAQAQKYLDAFSSKDKQMAVYDAPHALNNAARLDRVRWLQKHLDFKKVDEKELEAIPQLK
ncbi:MAG TPA: hypothetical protein VE133_14735, partial [Candidatus Sulfotelmatobacter sp.]|nr:hypothetical protein [Candidatus Sulfotelmatobacter sp.]